MLFWFLRWGGPPSTLSQTRFCSLLLKATFPQKPRCRPQKQFLPEKSLSLAHGNSCITRSWLLWESQSLLVNLGFWTPNSTLSAGPCTPQARLYSTYAGHEALLQRCVWSVLFCLLFSLLGGWTVSPRYWCNAHSPHHHNAAHIIELSVQFPPHWVCIVLTHQCYRICNMSITFLHLHYLLLLR